MELEHLPPDEVQASIDQALRFSLEVSTFAKVLRVRHEELPDFGPEMGVALLKSYQDDEWGRGAWLSPDGQHLLRGREEYAGR